MDMLDEVYPCKNYFLSKAPLALNDDTDKVRIFFLSDTAR